MESAVIVENGDAELQKSTVALCKRPEVIKVAVVTGAAMGIEQAMTEIHLQNGAKVVLLDVNESGGKSVKEALNKQFGPDKTLILTCSVESQEQIKAGLCKIVETFRGIDIICNNAGVLNESQWERTVSVNLISLHLRSEVQLNFHQHFTYTGAVPPPELWETEGT